MAEKAKSTFIPVLNQAGEKISKVSVSNDVFGIEPNKQVMFDAVQVYQSNMRQATAQTLRRDEVSGGGKKPWRQKGTGRARCGSNRSPVWVGGGTTFGPQPRSYAKKMPRKARRLALCCALSAKVAAGELVVVEGLAFDAPKTKQVASLLKAFEAVDTKALLITDGSNENVALSARNMPKVTTITNMGLNCFDILNSKKVFLAKDAVEKIEEVLA